MRNNIVYITGRKGSGKTSLAHVLARRAYYSGARVVVVAPVGGISLPGAPVIRGSALPGVWGNLHGRSCVVIPEEDQVAEDAFSFCWHVQEKARAPLLLVVDEVALYLPPARLSVPLMRVIRYGRHRSISLVTTSQRPASVHNDLIAQADQRCLFAQSEPNDCKYLRQYTGVDLEALASLPDLSYLRFAVGGEPVSGSLLYRYGVPYFVLDSSFEAL